MEDDKGSVEPRRWAPNRIASAVVLVLLLCAGVAYGIYSLTSNGGSNQSTTTNNNQHLTPPTPSPKSSPKTPSTSQPSPGSSQSSGSSSSSGNSSSAPSSGSSSQNGQLSNTGPGSTALIGFGVAFVVGTAAHYGWRKLRLTT